MLALPSQVPCKLGEHLILTLQWGLPWSVLGAGCWGHPVLLRRDVKYIPRLFFSCIVPEPPVPACRVPAAVLLPMLFAVSWLLLQLHTGMWRPQTVAAGGAVSIYIQLQVRGEDLCSCSSGWRGRFCGAMLVCLSSLALWSGSLASACSMSLVVSTGAFRGDT